MGLNGGGAVDYSRRWCFRSRPVVRSVPRVAPSESPLLDPLTLEILETAYLQRCPTVDHLRAALPQPTNDFTARLEALCAGGFLTQAGGRLDYTSPYTAFIAIGAARAERIVDEAVRTTALMQALPRLIRAWDISEVEDGGRHPLSVNIIHAVTDSGDAWFHHAAAETASRPSLVFPEKGPLLAALRAGHLADLQARMGDGHVRVLLNVDIAPTDELARGLDQARALGVQFRRSRNTPSWLYVDGASIVGLPILWGSPAPTRLLAVRTPPVVAAVALVFDELWRAADRWDEPADTWMPILGLMSQGLTDEAIAQRLGLTDRTVRRRIAEAMTELGVTSRFALGMAWQRLSGR
jgi:hypothetical protein